MLLLNLTLGLVLLGSSWGEWASTGPGFLPRGSRGGQAGWKGSRWIEWAKEKGCAKAGRRQEVDRSLDQAQESGRV